MSISVQLGWLPSTGPSGRQHSPAVLCCSCQCHNPATKRLLFPITLVSGSPWLRICCPLCLAPWMSAQAPLRPVPPGSDPASLGDACVPCCHLAPHSTKACPRSCLEDTFSSCGFSPILRCPLTTSPLQTIGECIISLQNPLEIELPGNSCLVS